MAVAERTELGVEGRELPLPPARLPVGVCETALQRYRAGIEDRAEFIAAIDRHGHVLEQLFAQEAARLAGEWGRTIAVLETLHEQLSNVHGQAAWLKHFPHGEQAPVRPLSCRVADTSVEVPSLLAGLRAIELDETLLAAGATARPRPMRQRSKHAGLAALQDCGFNAVDLARELGANKESTWSQLTGHRPASPDLHRALRRLVGADMARVVLRAIPDRHSAARVRKPPSEAVQALHRKQVTILDLAPLIPISPSRLRSWLSSGDMRPHQRRQLERAIEQLLPGQSAEILGLIPHPALGSDSDAQQRPIIASVDA